MEIVPLFREKDRKMNPSPARSTGVQDSRKIADYGDIKEFFRPKSNRTPGFDRNS